MRTTSMTMATSVMPMSSQLHCDFPRGHGSHSNSSPRGKMMQPMWNALRCASLSHRPSRAGAVGSALGAALGGGLTAPSYGIPSARSSIQERGLELAIGLSGGQDGH